MNISYVTTYNAQDIHNWSGIGYYMANALINQQHRVDFIGNLQRNLTPLLIAKKLGQRLVNKSFDLNRSRSVVKGYSRQIEIALKGDTDIIFSPGSIPISLLEVNKPKVFYTDASFAGMLGFYPEFSNLCSETIADGNYLEKAALESAAIAIYSSEWAASTAIKHYGINSEKVKVVPFGANVEDNRSFEDIKKIVSNRPASECHLLFLGTDWLRKGGDTALKITEILNQSGIRTFLHVAGVQKIPVSHLPEYVIQHGFISKYDKTGKDRIDYLLGSCNFLLLPTKADCTPVVYSEANSFGLPCITTNVGGIATIIKQDINGKMFSVNDDSIEYAKYIQSIFGKQEFYRELCYSAYNEYLTRLNWKVAGSSITALLKEL